MKGIIATVLLFCSLLSANVTAADETAYRVDLKVFRDSQLIASPSAGVKEGKAGDLTIDSSDPAVPNLRLVVTAESGPELGNGKEAATIKIMFFEWIDDAWSLRSEPSAATYLGSEASLQVVDSTKSDGPKYEIRVVATKFDPTSAGDKTSFLGGSTSGSGCPARPGTLSFDLAAVFGISTAQAAPC